MTEDIRVVVLPSNSARAFDDDLDPGDPSLTLVAGGPSLLIFEDAHVNLGSGWVLWYLDENGDPDDYFVGGDLDDVDAALTAARRALDR